MNQSERDSRLLAVDVGGHVKGCSGAFFTDGELSHVWARLDRLGCCAPARVIVERPQQDGRSRAVPPAILMDLCWTGALLVGGFAALGAGVREVEPREWKGETAKAIMHKRLWVALTPRERIVFPEGTIVEIEAACRKGALCRWKPHKNGHYREGSSTPDILDAVGLGLWHLGRITREGYAKGK